MTHCSANTVDQSGSLLQECAAEADFLLIKPILENLYYIILKYSFIQYNTQYIPYYSSKTVEIQLR